MTTKPDAPQDPRLATEPPEAQPSSRTTAPQPDPPADPPTPQPQPQPAGRPSALARPPQVVLPQTTNGRPICPGCARGILVINGQPRKSDGARPVRCSHCGVTAALLVDGRLELRR